MQCMIPPSVKNKGTLQGYIKYLKRATVLIPYNNMNIKHFLDIKQEPSFRLALQFLIEIEASDKPE